MPTATVDAEAHIQRVTRFRRAHPTAIHTNRLQVPLDDVTNLPAITPVHSNTDASIALPTSPPIHTEHTETAAAIEHPPDVEVKIAAAGEQRS